jgi:hypothetical protein
LDTLPVVAVALAHLLQLVVEVVELHLLSFTETKF